MSSLKSVLLLSLFTVGLAHNAAKHFVKGLHRGHSHGVKFKHRLRVCNAYPFADGLDVLRGDDTLTNEPLDYKMCGDFSSPLLAGDKLKFMVGGASAGTFTISDLPNNDAVLLLVIHRHDTLSTSVSFQSHVFANLLNAQVAIIDTYKGRARGFAEITDGSKRDEKLRYNSLVALNPGKYEVSLLDHRNKKVSMQKMVALNRESYVIIRTGVESEQGTQYAQELMVYPMSDAALLHSGSMRNSLPMGVLAALFAIVALRQ